jgi:hypothetical protein
VNGFFWSGSSAIVDFLSDFKCIGRVPYEFNDFRRIGWIGDLIVQPSQAIYVSTLKDFIRVNGRAPKSKIHRFKELLWQTLYPSRSSSLKTLEKRYNLLFDLYDYLATTSSKSDRIAQANRWIEAVSECYAPKKDFVIFDQPLRICQHSDIWRGVFEPFKLILIYRDPRDQFADIINRKKLYDDFINAEDLGELFGRSHDDAMSYHINLLKKKLLVARDNYASKSDTLLMSFESFIENHAEKSQQIIEFLGFTNTEKIQTQQPFRFEESKKNIGIYDKVLSKNDLFQLEEVLSIYNELRLKNE